MAKIIDSNGAVDCWFIAYPSRTYEVPIKHNAHEALHEAFQRNQSAYGRSGADEVQAMFRHYYVGNRPRNRSTKGN